MFLLEFSLWFGVRPLWHGGKDAVLCAKPYNPGRASTEKNSFPQFVYPQQWQWVGSHYSCFALSICEQQSNNPRIECISCLRRIYFFLRAVHQNCVMIIMSHNVFRLPRYFWLLQNRGSRSGSSPPHALPLSSHTQWSLCCIRLKGLSAAHWQTAVTSICCHILATVPWLVRFQYRWQLFIQLLEVQPFVNV